MENINDASVLADLKFDSLDIRLALDILSIPSYSGMEHLVQEFLMDFAGRHGMKARKDSCGNVYITKGELSEGEYYPCVCAHMDTVQEAHLGFIERAEPLPLKTCVTDGMHMIFCDGFGLGADDKAGMAIALSVMLSEDKIKGAFFVREEWACQGSEEADMDWFSDVGYIMEFDSPGHECSLSCGHSFLFDPDFYEKYLSDLRERCPKITWLLEPYTDVMMLRMNTALACMNFFAGYYHHHQHDEFCIAEEMDEAAGLGLHMIEVLGNREYVIPNEATLEPAKKGAAAHYFLHKVILGL